DTSRAVPDQTVPEQFRAQVARVPDVIALEDGTETLTYAELDRRSDDVARSLSGHGVRRGDFVALCGRREPQLIVAALGILKAGAAYLPLDPEYPQDRLLFMLEDSRAEFVLGDDKAETLARRAGSSYVSWHSASDDSTSAPPELASDDLAYMIYTSGSTGRPKGVLVEHRNLMNFFEGMDEVVPIADGARWLAVTSLSFDISVLELFWTLCRGRTVVLATELGGLTTAEAQSGPKMSLFYFAAAGADSGPESDPYRLLLEGAEFADREGFEAVWVPERHFHEFGGSFPNPAVAAAAVAARTQRVQLRAGSVVSPLHHPARIAEEWAMVDRLSRGRVGLSFASGWHPNDFALRPETFEDRKQQVSDDIATVRRLWSGESVSFAGPQGPVELATLPRPVQKELPLWLTTAGNPETFREAGRLGTNVLTHLLGQTIEELTSHLAEYRKARGEAGHAGPGHVTLMLHTFLGDSVDGVREIVREPMKNYLRSSLGLIRGFASQWSAFKRGADASHSLDDLTPEEFDELLDYSFERYFETSALFGTPASVRPLLEDVTRAGVDEVACLIDFGIEEDLVIEHLDGLRALKAAPASRSELPFASVVAQRAITHLQCTPSLMRLLLEETGAPEALGGLEALLLGGEALPVALADELQRHTPRILDMYGPTETTIWSTTHELEDAGERRGQPIPIGRPIANTQAYVLDDALRPVAPGVVGELYLGGAGVVRGYWQRPELDAERFVTSEHVDSNDRLYKTGDLAHWDGSGRLHYDGRSDFQVKLRGHRIELGEIESRLEARSDVRSAVVSVFEGDDSDSRLVAYFVADGPAPDAEELRGELKSTLPDFMVPAHFMRLDALPLTPNGKTDRKALPSPVLAARPAANGRPTVSKGAQSETEKKIAEIWQRVLGRDDLSVEDNFFDLGGHSLLAVRVHRELKAQFGNGLLITDLFRFPTIRSLSEHLAKNEAPPPADGAEPAPQLSASQRRAALRRQRRGKR
ncbi:MAG: MupA/Atu3671 family FMN-dependent luciferase-like monooxygenase, partial [Acidobacteriota bacterium]